MDIRYTSTRDNTVNVSFLEAMLRGQPPGGGLYMPARIPDLSANDWTGATPLPTLARQVLAPWVGTGYLDVIDLEGVFNFEITCVDLGARSTAFRGLHVLELFNGPTLSFKDFGARFLAACVRSHRERNARNETEPALVLVATSGDTGSAVADAFKGIPGLGVVLLYPRDGVSAMQRHQLTDPRAGVWPFAVTGSFDDCQMAVKQALANGIDGVRLISANSINVGRMLPQMLFYFCGASSVASTHGPTFVVPSGNLGNLTAGLLASVAGRMNASFVAATNANDYFVRALHDPTAAKSPLRNTFSNAMDVADPSNFERILSLLGEHQDRASISADSATDEETLQTMRLVFEETGYHVDPHTAVGLAVARKYTGALADNVVVMATAHPCKYREIVFENTGSDPSTGIAPVAVDPFQTIAPGILGLEHVIREVVKQI